MTRVNSAREHAGKAGKAAAVIAATAVESIDLAPDLMAGPNPFVGLRPEDLVSTAQQVGAQCMQEPVLVLEQQAQLAQDLVSVLDGSAPSPSARDRRFGDPSWQDNPLYRMSLPLEPFIYAAF